MTNDFLLHTALSAPTAPTRVADVSIHLPKVKCLRIFLSHTRRDPATERSFQLTDRIISRLIKARKGTTDLINH